MLEPIFKMQIYLTATPAALGQNPEVCRDSNCKIQIFAYEVVGHGENINKNKCMQIRVSLVLSLFCLLWSDAQYHNGHSHFLSIFSCFLCYYLFIYFAPFSITFDQAALQCICGSLYVIGFPSLCYPPNK